MRIIRHLPNLFPTGVTLMPDGVTIVGVTTFTPLCGVDSVVIDGDPAVEIFCVAAAAAAKAAIPVICPPVDTDTGVFYEENN